MGAAFVAEARLELDRGVDPASVGAAVTTELCGHWEHDGACRFPHHNEVDVADATGPGGAAAGEGRVGARLRTVFVADGEDQAVLVSQRVDRALRAAAFWRVASYSVGPVADDERALADRLLAGPRAAPE